MNGSKWAHQTANTPSQHTKWTYKATLQKSLSNNKQKTINVKLTLIVSLSRLSFILSRYVSPNYFLTPVFPPPSNVRSTGLLVCHAPRVKSGISTVMDFLPTDLPLSGKIQLHDAASYTF